jgi:hypothetical protein
MLTNWQGSTVHNSTFDVIESQTLWGEMTCQVWLQGRDTVVPITSSRFKPLENAKSGSPDYIAYKAAAARVADAIAQDVLLAPIESSAIPLAHQIRAVKLQKQIDGERSNG